MSSGSGYSPPTSDNEQNPNPNPGPNLASIEQSLDAIDNQLASISMAQPGSLSVTDLDQTTAMTSNSHSNSTTNDSMEETEYSTPHSNLAVIDAYLEDEVAVGVVVEAEEAENDLPSPSSSGYAAERGSSDSVSALDGLLNNEDGGEIREVRGDDHDHDDTSRILDSHVPPQNRNAYEDDASISWRKRKKHFIVLSHAGKPIYSRYGDVHRLAGFAAILQAIVSFVENGKDRVKWVRAGRHQVVFLVKGPIYLVCISCTDEPYESLKGQLELFYGQMILILTKSVNRCFERNPKFDMTPLLGGTDAIFSSLIQSFSRAESVQPWDAQLWLNRPSVVRNPATFLHAYTCLPLSLATRQTASAILQDVADSGVLFAILMCREKAISLVGASKASLHADDILLLSHFVMSSESFRTSESFSPICLPRYNPTAFLHAYVHYFDVDTYLILLTANSDSFYHLKDCRIHIENVLLKSNVLVEVQRSIVERGMRVDELLVDLNVHPGQPRLETPDSSGRSSVFCGLGGPAGLWHFIYRSNYLDQYVSSEFSSPINGLNQQKRLYRAYQKIYSSMHQTGNGPHRTMFRRDENYVLLCWITQDFDFYAAFDPLADKALAIQVCNHVCRRVKDNENEIFILGASPFAW